MTEFRIESASDVPFADVAHALTGGGNGGSCWCRWFLSDGSTFPAPPQLREERAGALEAELAHAQVAPALVAYLDDEAVGWCRVGPRTSLPRLNRTVAATRGRHEDFSDPQVWAVVCFVVRAGFRRIGVSRALLDEAVVLARRNGASRVEAYPIDTEQRPSTPPNNLFVGTVGLYRSAGFTVVGIPAPGRAVMERTFD